MTAFEELKDAASVPVTFKVDENYVVSRVDLATLRLWRLAVVAVIAALRDEDKYNTAGILELVKEEMDEILENG